jgi:hypothetical protein
MMPSLSPYATKTLVIAACCTVVAGVLGVLLGDRFITHVATPRLGIAGDKFSLNGTPTFLLGASYFDALGWKASDFDALAARRFNLIRIWMDWHVWTDRSRTFFDVDGHLRYPQTLLELVRAAGARGLMVDVTILHGASLSRDMPQPMHGTGAAENAMRNTVGLLKDEPNVFFDLVNEHDGSGTSLAWHTTMAALVGAARQADAAALITFSSCDACRPHLLASDTTAHGTMVNEELEAGSRWLTPHFSRCGEWWNVTGVRVRTLKQYLHSIGRNVPVYLQEESRRKGVNCGTDPTQANFVQAATAARDAGAAGWVFHTDAGFDLSGSQTFLSRLDAVERATVDTLGRAVFGNGAVSPTSAAGEETRRPANFFQLVCGITAASPSPLSSSHAPTRWPSQAPQTPTAGRNTRQPVHAAWHNRRADRREPDRLWAAPV